MKSAGGKLPSKLRGPDILRYMAFLGGLVRLSALVIVLLGIVTIMILGLLYDAVIGIIRMPGRLVV